MRQESKEVVYGNYRLVKNILNGDGNIYAIHWCQYDAQGVLRTITESASYPLGHSLEEIEAEMKLMVEQAASQPIIVERYKQDKKNPSRTIREFVVPPDGKGTKQLIRRYLITEYNIQIGAPKYKTCAVIVNQGTEQP
jgi:hypothetical protein